MTSFIGIVETGSADQNIINVIIKYASRVAILKERVDFNKEELEQMWIELIF